MNEKKARKILGNTIKPDNRLSRIAPYVDWHPDYGNPILDGEFPPEVLGAITWWIKNKGC